MHIRDNIIRHKTLFRFISTILLVAVGIFVFYGWSVLQRSQEQIAAQFEQNYTNTAAELNAAFVDQLPVMFSTARLFQREKNVNRAWLESQFYNFILLIDGLAEYRKAVWIADEVYLILQDASYVLSSQYKYETDYFFSRYGDAGGPFEAVLRNAVYDEPVSELTILSGFPYGVDRFYIAVPFSNDQAMVLFSLTEESIRRYFMGVANENDLGFMIYDEAGSLLFSSARINAGLLADQRFATFLDSKINAETLQIGDTNYIAAQSHAYKYRLKFVVIQQQPLINQSLDRFYAYLLQITVVFFVLLIVFISIAVYINFLPIARLVKGLNRQKKPVSEIDAICNVLSDYELETEQMQDTMKDYIVRRLIEGHTVADDVLADLGLQPNDSFFVLAVAGLLLPAEQCKHMGQQLQESVSLRLFITTLSYESYAIVLCAASQAAEQSPLQGKRHLLAGEILEKAAGLTDCATALRAGVGMVVGRTEDIHRSYLGALTAIESDSTDSIILYEENMDLGFGDLESDYNKIMMKLFKHMQQGDRVYAQLTLRELFDYVQLNAPSLLVQRYFCYDIINTYLKHVQKNNFEINSEVSEAILHGDSPQNLYLSLQKSVDDYCAWATQQQEKQQQDSARQIADYVDERFTDPALSLDMIADHFSISIYMVSRILKDYWHCGYKEYLTEKRIRFGKQLLEKNALSITDIATAAGFNDAMHFSRTFRANTGISPVQYRKIMAANLDSPHESS